ncbi:MAG: ABC transporter substrate-binding protein [Actinobacteria bacterium]|nr:ABC transporter substrate-binding protein [Actinomycetota bacterium]
MIRRYTHWRATVVPVAAVAALLAACGGGGTGAGPGADGQSPPARQEGPTIDIGSFNFPESEILAEIYAQGLDAHGYPVATKQGIGSREVTQPALARGDIDMIIEYTGNALRFQRQGEQVDLREEQEVYDALQEEYRDEGITSLQMASAQDVDAVAVTREFAEQHDLDTISDLATVPGTITFGASPECPERLSCLRGLREVYGLDVEFKELDAGGPVTVAALARGEVDAANLFTTQGVVAANDFVLLEDDKNLQLPQNIVPVVRDGILDAYGEPFRELVNSVTAQITTNGLTELNKRVEVDKEDPSAVAEDWLREHGFLD